MKFGVSFPQDETVSDIPAIRDFAQAVEGLGYDFIVTNEHVVGADPEKYPGRQLGFTYKNVLHEPFALMSYLAAITQRVELTTAVIILSQRQTVLFAKQAAEVDVLSQGRLRLGVGLGWNDIEFEALNENFHNRGARIAEQLDVMRQLWTNPTIDYKGRWHRINNAGINPLPVQRPIPLWMGGLAPVALRRLVKISDGWVSFFPPRVDPADAVRDFHAALREAGKEPGQFGFQRIYNIEGKTAADWLPELRSWPEIGVTHVAVGELRGDIAGQIAKLRAFRESVAELAG